LPDADAEDPALDDLALIAAAAEAAGRIALAFFGNQPRAWTKGADSPVTEADIASDRYLFETLLSARPDYGWLSEETADTPDRLTRERIFIVDPIDGTRGFMEGSLDWCVSVAVVERGRPIAGVLSVPARGELFEATRGGGARLNGRPLLAVAPEAGATLRFSGPMRHQRAFAAAGLAIGERRVTPSLAYRLALVAAGRLEVATASPDARDWDLAAADLLVHEAGGTLHDAAGLPVRYNRPDPRHGALVATVPGLADATAGPVGRAEAEAERRRRS